MLVVVLGCSEVVVGGWRKPFGEVRDGTRVDKLEQC